MPILASLGAGAIGAYRMFRGGAAPVVNYVEDVFSTYLYNGTGSTQTITNGIDVSGKGGLVWIKKRTFTVVGEHRLFDTARTANGGYLVTNNTGAETGSGSGFSFDSTGFTYGYGNSGETLVSWTFCEQAKFFDIVTYTGNGANNRQISHNLGSAPGCIILKRTDGAGDWWTYHRSLGDVGGFSYDLQLNTTSNKTAYQIFGTASTQTSTYFTLGTVFANEMNGNGATYVAYLFAHDAGGFGAAGSDNVISCGSFTTNGSGVATVDLGYEPQFILFKRTDSADNWEIADTMRGFSVNSNGTSSSFKRLNPNTSDAETTSSNFEMYLTSTGFKTYQYFYNATYIYIAIRRGPMKTPTSGANVYNAIARTGTGTSTAVTGVGFPPDALLQLARNGFHSNLLVNRLIGANNYLTTDSTSQEAPASDAFFTMDGYTATSYLNYNTSPDINYFFRRSPGFFDVVCYTGTGANRTVSHNLTVVPELIIVKCRSTARAWPVYAASIGNTNELRLNETSGSGSTFVWNSTTPTSSVFSLGTPSLGNFSGDTYVAYLFATVAGVSKVGSYTGNGSSQTINCAFTAGARFILIKRTDSAGGWHVWDTARGIVSGNDPYLLLNTVASEVTTNDSIDPDNTGFIVNQLAATDINVNNATYIFLAIA